MTLGLIIVGALLFMSEDADHAVEEAIRIEAVVPAPIADVWAAWTTVEGVQSFFAPAARIDLRPGGAYEIYFDPSAPPGRRGADDMRVMLVQPQAAFAFTWNAPEKFPNARAQQTHVMIRFTALSPSETKIVLAHDGFGEGAEWEAVRSYFRAAWGGHVIPRLIKRFETPPRSAP